MNGYWTQRVRKAIVIASSWHDGQKRKEANIPYNAHLWGVSMLLALSGACEDIIIAGIFHDILEDTKIPLEQLGWQFGPQVLYYVQQLTEPKNMDWQPRKETMLERIRSAVMPVRMIKCADKVDNLQSFYEGIKAEGFREGQDCRQAMIWEGFHGGYESQKWYNQEILKALFSTVAIANLPPLFGTYMRLVELVFGEKVITDEKARQRVVSS